MSGNVIITGAAGALGSAVVKKFLSTRSSVIATVSPGKTLDTETKGTVDVVGIDLTNVAEVNKFIDNTVAKHRTIKSAVLLVGGFAMGNISNTSLDDIQKMFSLNFATAYNVVKPLMTVMSAQPDGGRFVLVGSKPALNPNDGKNAVAYSLSKSLVFRLAELINAEGAKQNVVAHVVVPSIIDTPQNRKSMPDANFANWVKPEEIANTIHFLCSDEGALIREGVVKVYGKS